MEPGDHNALESVQGLMRKATQSNLSSFHEAGLKSTSGNLTVQNVLDVTDNENFYMNVVVDDEKLFKMKFIRRKLKYYVMEYKPHPYLIKDDPDSFWNLKYERELIAIVRLYTDYRKLTKDCRSLQYIKEKIEARMDVTVTVSSDFVGIIDIRTEHEVNESNYKKIYEILNIDLGVEGILDYSNGIVKGSNLDIMSRVREVDGTKLTSNNIKQVQKRFGIEAARYVIFREIGVSYDEVGVIADYMTWHGEVFPFTKFSPDQERKGILTSMGFERPNYDLSKLVNGPIHDEMKSVYSQAMVGIKTKIGSNSSNFEVINP